MHIDVPHLSLVVLVGASGSGKSSFARTHFKPTEILSSDACRGLVSDDENNQSATDDAFDVLHYIAAKRLKNGLLTVIDATNLRPEDRREYVRLAREYHCLPVAIVLDLPERVCQARNAGRADRQFGEHVVRSQRMALRRHLRGLRREGFRHVWVLESEEEVAGVTVCRTPLWNNRRGECGPFDIVGDVHGCFDELVELLEKLGWVVEREEGLAEGDWSVTWSGGARSAPPQDDARLGQPCHQEHGRKLVFLGDLVDRGPKSPAVLRLVMRAVAEGKALCVPGNHDMKLVRKLGGKDVKLTHGLAATMAQLEGETPEFLAQVREFLDGLVSHYVLDGGRLVVAHAGLKEEMQGRGSGAVREFCLYGETTGETDEFGLPVRYNWAAEYRGRATVVYGHVAVPEAEWLNNTIDIDTGCVFGGKLTALRYPEREVVSVAARAVYAEPARPLGIGPNQAGARTAETAVPPLSAQQRHDDMLDLADALGKRIIETRLQQNVIVREENAAAALEVMSRFAADPRWLIYLPPTMSPCETSGRAGLLEHPEEALAYYRTAGVPQAVCEEKHMGSRAVVVVCRDENAAHRRFGVTTGEIGIIYTRTGRRFFEDSAMEAALLGRIRAAADAAGIWDELRTAWLCLDCELMPWSAKAQALLRDQYAAVASAGRAGLEAAVAELGLAAERMGVGVGEVQAGSPHHNGEAIGDLLGRYQGRREAVEQYTEAYGRYCWPVESIDDLRLAPFHLLASEGGVHVDRDHLWHMATLARLAGHDELLMATSHRTVELTDESSCAAAVAWWEELTGRGGEGMVVKPRAFVARGARGLLQPAVKCRGAEYLRIIYGPEYLAAEHLERLRRRGLKHKRSMALREFALGVEGLERFVRREPLRRVHECVFGVLALESEPVDPRL
jgi:protein phosphatase